ncbi:benzoylformate decarboxylase [Actinocrispum sp. NPDC049592]|uniref:benzoylformate decarboxylase n=1 Tax=Actinocrispum sp. NPDC049592 TaxID=3154835 RepID=UPI00342D1C93
MTTPSVRDVARDLLRDFGLTTVFGNPGTTEIPFLVDWPAGFRYVLGLQEAAVVAMADGYAQAADQPVLVNLHSAGGLGHGLGHVFTAYRNRTPMLVLAGQQVRSLLPGEPFLGASDPTVFPRPYVKWSCEPARAQDVAAALAHAYHLAVQPPTGPAFISVPADDWDAPSEGAVPVRPRILGPVAAPEALSGLASAVDGAERPVIVVGAAVDAEDAVADVVALAERIRAGVFVAPMSSRCSFPEDHPLFQGFLDPEERSIAAALEPYDLALVLGAPVFTLHVFRGNAATPLPPLFLINDDPDVLARAKAGVGIRSMIGPAVRRLSEMVVPVDRVTPKPLVRPAIPADSDPVSPVHVLAALANLLPDNALVVEEAPSHRNLMHDYLPIRARHTGFLTMASGTLGWGLPAAVGAALGRPDRRVVAILGDGSSMYGIQALWTAARENLPMTFVILDNAEYAALKLLSSAEQKIPGTDLGGIDFAALATSLGCYGITVESIADFRTALKRSLIEDRPTVVHVRVTDPAHTLY